MAETKNNLNRNQKLALVGLTIFGFFLVGIWLLELNSEIVGPIGFKLSADNTASTTQLTTVDQLKSQDTDGDGLSDWDELNIYNTSPYLADSDSDGIPDGVEVANGTDPNCPQGRNCNSILLVATSSVPVIGQSNGGAANSGQTLASSSQTDLLNLLTGATDAATLRKILIQSGMDKASLDQISDTDLMKNYQALVASNTKSQQ